MVDPCSESVIVIEELPNQPQLLNLDISTDIKQIAETVVEKVSLCIPETEHTVETIIELVQTPLSPEYPIAEKTELASDTIIHPFSKHQLPSTITENNTVPPQQLPTLTHATSTSSPFTTPPSSPAPTAPSSTSSSPLIPQQLPVTTPNLTTPLLSLINTPIHDEEEPESDLIESLSDFMTNPLLELDMYLDDIEAIYQSRCRMEEKLLSFERMYEGGGERV